MLVTSSIRKKNMTVVFVQINRTNRFTSILRRGSKGHGASASAEIVWYEEKSLGFRPCTHFVQRKSNNALCRRKRPFQMILLESSSLVACGLSNTVKIIDDKLVLI